MTTDNTDPTEFGANPFEADPDELESASAALAEARERLANVPAEVVVTNHAMGLYELAAIHLSAAPPRLPQAALAIDAFACLVEGLAERIGESHDTLLDALANIRLVYVEIARANKGE